MSPRPKPSRKLLIVAGVLMLSVMAGGPLMLNQYAMYQETDRLADSMERMTTRDFPASEQHRALRRVAAPLLAEQEAAFEAISDLAEAKPPLVTAKTLDDPWAPVSDDSFNHLGTDTCRAAAENVKVPILRAAADTNCDAVAEDERKLDKKALAIYTVSDFGRACAAKYLTYTQDWPKDELAARKADNLRGMLYMLMDPTVTPAFPEQESRIRDLVAQLDADVTEFATRDACFEALPALAEPKEYVAPGAAG